MEENENQEVEAVETEEVETVETEENEQENPVVEFLDELSEDNDEPSEPEDESDSGEPQDNQQDSQEQAEQTANEQNQQNIQDNQAKSPEQELLDDVKSERSKARIKQWIDEHNQLKEQSKQVEETNRQFAEIVKNTGMNNEELAQTLEFCRLSRQNDEGSLKVALEMLERERQSIYARMGMAAPGSDALAGFDDLKQAVESMDISEDKARELASLRRFRQQQMNQAQQQAMAIRQQEEIRQQNMAHIENFKRNANLMFEGQNGNGGLKAIDPNYQARINAVGQWLNSGGQQWMIQNLRPDQWTNHLFNVYQTVQYQTPQVNKIRNAPISGKPQNIAKPSIKGNTSGEVVASVFDNLGL